MRKTFLISLFFLLLFINPLVAKEKLVFYIGITMVKPIQELVTIFENTHNCEIKILQGGSQDLYDSARMSGVGDLYLPGSISYRKKNLKDGILLDAKFVGFNRLALIVQKGNPKDIKPNLKELANPNYRVVLGNHESSSVGNATKKLLEQFNLYEKAILNAIYLESDSRNLSASIINNQADLVMNWYATSFWDFNKEQVESLLLEDKYSKKTILALNLLKSSKNKKLTKEFMSFAASKTGREVFKKYGFLTKKEFENFDKVKIR